MKIDFIHGGQQSEVDSDEQDEDYTYDGTQTEIEEEDLFMHSSTEELHEEESP